MNAAEIVLTAADVRVVKGNWKKRKSAGSPGSRALVSVNRRRSFASAPRPDPKDYFEATFRPVAGCEDVHSPGAVTLLAAVNLARRSTDHQEQWRSSASALLDHDRRVMRRAAHELSLVGASDAL